MARTSERTLSTRSVVLVLASLAAGWVIASYLHRYGLAALTVDRAAVRGWLAGDGLYAYQSPWRIGTSQPPVAALLLVGAVGVPLAVAGWILALVSVAALILAVAALTGPVVRGRGWPRWPVALLVGALALSFEPVRATLGEGRLDLLLFGLVAADVVGLRRAARWRRQWPAVPAPAAVGSADLLRRWWRTGAWAGVGTGVAAALAVRPVLFIGYLALTRQWRATLTALGTAATLLTSALLIAPGTTMSWLDTVLLDADRSGAVRAAGNQSLAGVLTRLYQSDSVPVLIWLSFAALLVALGLSRARSAHAAGDEGAAFTLVGLTGAAVAPVTYVHDLLWLLPAVLVLAEAGSRRQASGRPPRTGRFPSAGWLGAAAALCLLMAAPPSWTVSWNAYALVVIVLLNALPARPAELPTPPAATRRVPAIPGPRGS